MKNRILALICFTALAAQPVFSQSVGTTVFEFLRSQYSARGAAMANNLVAVQGDVNAAAYNPAVLSTVTEPQWTINFTDHLLDFQAGQLGYAFQKGQLGTIGFGLIYFDYGDFEETDLFGEETGRSFGASEFADTMGADLNGVPDVLVQRFLPQPARAASLAYGDSAGRLDHRADGGAGIVEFQAGTG